MKQDAKNPRKLITGKFRASFAHVFKRGKPMNEGEEGKYSLSMLFPKEGFNRKAVEATMMAAIKDKWGDKIPTKLRSPIRDGDEKFEENPDLYGAYEGHFYINASSKQKPGVVDQALNPITDESEFYSGCFGRATLMAFGYDTKGNRGVAFGLQNIQKMADGESLGGRVSADRDFDALDGGDDESNYSTDNSSSLFE